MTEHPTLDEARAAEREFRQTSTLRWKETRTLPPGSYSVVYTYNGRDTSRRDCVVKMYGTLTVTDPKEVDDALKSRVAGLPKHYVTEPRVIRTWTGGGLRRVTRSYGTVDVTYTGRLDGSASTVHVNVKNNHPDQDAVLRFTVNGILQEQTFVAPAKGGSASGVIGRDVSTFGALVKLVPVSEGKKRTTVDWMKEEIREQVTIRKGLIAVPEPDGLGGRG